MTLSLSHDVNYRDPIRGGILPEKLIAEGIVSDPTTPTGAFKRGRGMVRQGDYQQARAILYPHAGSAPVELRYKLAELLGLCAAHQGGEWRSLYDEALAGFKADADSTGVARIHGHIGEMLMHVGDLEDAESHLLQADQIYTDLGDNVRSALIKARRGKLRFKSGRVKQALPWIDSALAILLPLRRRRPEGLVRLERARVLAALGDPHTAAKELILGERLLASGGDSADRLRARIVRAETLLNTGQIDRAAWGLRRLLPELSRIDDARTRAWGKFMLGQSLAESQPTASRRNLSRARHLYQGLGSEYGVCRCDIWLAYVESRMGLNPKARCKALSQQDLKRWPLLAYEFRIARACAVVVHDREQARRVFLGARTFANKTANRALAIWAENRLREYKLVDAETLEPLDSPGAGDSEIPVDMDLHVTPGGIPQGGPQPMDDDDLEFVSSPRVSAPAPAPAQSSPALPKLHRITEMSSEAKSVSQIQVRLLA